MNQEESSQEIKDFIAGLKMVIRNQWPTQEAFAKGVTSKVNLSNILRGKVGTSHSMKKALADKAGLTVEEVIAMGKKMALGPIGTREIQESSPDQTKPDLNEYNYMGGSAAELVNMATDYTMTMQSELSNYGKKMTNLFNGVLAERDKLVKLLAQEQSITNALTTGVKVVDRNLKITYVNRAMMEKFFIAPGDVCNNENYPFNIDIEEVLTKVFDRGSVMHKLVLHDGEHYLLTTAPILDPSWLVTHAVVSITPASPFIQLLKEAGWTPPVTEKKENI